MLGVSDAHIVGAKLGIGKKLSYPDAFDVTQAYSYQMAADLKNRR